MSRPNSPVLSRALPGRAPGRGVMASAGIATTIVVALAAAGCHGSDRGRSSAAAPVEDARGDVASPRNASDGDLDAGIERAVAASAYVVRDLRSGGMVREQRGEWLDTPAWPGSIAKIATLAAALETRTLTDRTRIVCTRQLTLSGGRRVDCSHPPLGRPLSVVDALAHSCNVFVATVARTLSRAQLSDGFVRMGLRPLPATADPIASALGLDGAKVPPRLLMEPVIRLARVGGDRGDDRAGDRAGDRAEDTGDRADRGAPLSLLRDGLHESARQGTASALGVAGIDAFAKTGTAPMPGGRSLGIVSVVAPASAPRYAMVLALPGGTGTHAAETAAAILAPLLRVEASSTVSVRVGRPPRGEGDDAEVAPRMEGRAPGRPYAVETLPLEDYVAQVVSGETSGATPAAARDALAMTARTYALANRTRHAADGFDLCSLTHCQVTRPATPESRAAAERTSGQVLVDERNQDAARQNDSRLRPAQVFYSASCGGQLADVRALLPDVDPATMPWLAARPDPARVDEVSWQSEIPARDLVRALQDGGYRGDVLRDLRFDDHAPGARISVAGFTPSVLSTDGFRRIVGQQLGWQLLKSTRFTVERTASGYRFQGRGHGHGVGLCVLGASALATRGGDAIAILAAYFPGLSIWNGQGSGQAGPAIAPGKTGPVIDLRLPSADESQRARLVRLLQNGLRDLGRRLDLPPPARLAVIVHPTSDAYRRATGRPWWTSGATLIDGRDVSLHLPPLAAIDRYARLEQTIRHELVHVLTVRELATRPRWVHEGLAIHFAGERVSVVEPQDGGATRKPAACPTDRELMRAPNRDAFERAYASAAACVARDLANGRAWRDLGAR